MRNQPQWCGVVLLCILTAAVASAQHYYPDHVGNRWILHSVDELDVRVTEVVGQEMLRGELVTLFSSGTNDANPDRFYVTVGPDGLLIHRAEVRLNEQDLQFDYDPPQFFLPYPLSVGASWVTSGESVFAPNVVISTENVTTAVAKEDVTVPAGSFQNVFKLQQDVDLITPLGSFPIQRFIWLAPDVGIVKEINSNGVEFQLIEYHVVVDPSIAVQPEGKLPLAWSMLKSDRL